jgi:hypothetical protein
MLTDQIATAVMAARSSRVLDTVAKTMWRAAVEGHVGEEDAGRLAEAIEACRAALRAPTAPARPIAPRKRSSPRSPDRRKSLERRRRLAASGPMPPAIACRFTTSQLAVLRVVADEVREHGRCTRCLDEIAGRAGVCRRTAQAALREAQRLGLVSIVETKRTAWLNAPNTVSIVSSEWRLWLRLGPAGTRMQKGADHGQEFYSKGPNSPAAERGEPKKTALRRSEGNRRAFRNGVMRV